MIQITARMRVLVAIEPVDGRKGIDALARLCQDKLAEDWVVLGKTTGRGKQSNSYVPNRSIKEVLGYQKIALEWPA